MDELRALLFGATIAAAIGPIALLVIHNGMRYGSRPRRGLQRAPRATSGAPFNLADRQPTSTPTIALDQTPAAPNAVCLGIENGFPSPTGGR